MDERIQRNNNKISAEGFRLIVDTTRRLIDNGFISLEMPINEALVIIGEKTDIRTMNDFTKKSNELQHTVSPSQTHEIKQRIFLGSLYLKMDSYFKEDNSYVPKVSDFIEKMEKLESDHAIASIVS